LLDLQLKADPFEYKYITVFHLPPFLKYLMALHFLLDLLYIRPYTLLLTDHCSSSMAPPTTKQYTITGPRWNDHRLSIQHSGLPILYVNSNNKYGPWKDPYVTIHQDAQNGPIVAAAKMGYPGCVRDFKIYQGNPDCTDLATWPVVKCLGKWAHEYRFCVELGGQLPLHFAWRRTRDKSLGASKKWHRDFKLVALGAPPRYEELSPVSTSGSCEKREVHLLDMDIDETRSNEKCSVDELEGFGQVPAGNVLDKNERVVGVYIHEPKLRTSPRQARINFFESLPAGVEMFCLTVVMGLQEKISRNQDAFTLGSMGYGGGLRPLGNYV
jgi:hypothetical protein